MDEVVFKRIGGRNVPTSPWPQQFYVSRAIQESGLDVVEVRPLTLTGLIKGVGKNFITMNYWRLRYGLWKCGLLDTPLGSRISLRHFRFDPWNVFQERKAKVKLQVNVKWT